MAQARSITAAALLAAALQAAASDSARADMPSPGQAVPAREAVVSPRRSSPEPPPGPGPLRIYNGRLGELDVTVPKVGAAIEVDGLLDEQVWDESALLTGFSQYLPVDGVPAVDSTEVHVLYSDHEIYFGVRAFEPHGAVAAPLADRDRIGSSDHVLLLLDTFDDQRRAFVFAVNALGVQSDGTFTEGVGTDLNPDYLYESKGRVTEWGYEVEVRIPFKSLRYQQSDPQQWGLQILRRVMHSGHEQTWTPVERGATSLLAQSGRLVDLRQMRRGLVLDLNPVMTSRVTGAPRADESGTGNASGDGWRYTREDPEFGANVRWGVTPNLALNATVNPDFSQIEADVGQVVYDPRRAISYPEKRPFFLEGSENFQVPNSLIYTRSIVAPVAAAKMSGKIGGLNVGVLSAVDDERVVPEVLEPGVEARSRNPVHNLIRLRRDLGEQSSLGIVYTDMIHGGTFNRVAGVDSRVVLGPYVLGAQVASSFSEFGGESSYWRPLFDFTVNRTGREAGFGVTLEGIHPEFEAASGFIARPGIAHASIVPRRTFFPENSVFESITVSPILDGTWDWDRFTAGTEPNDIKVNTSTVAVLRGGWRAQVYTWTETFKYPSNLYRDYYIERRDESGEVMDTVPYVGTDRLTNIGLMLSLTTPQWRQFTGRAEVLGGQDDNFDEWSSAYILYTTLEGDWRPTERLRVGGRFLEQRFYRKTDGSLVRLRSIPRLKLEYQVSRPVFLRFVGQYDGVKVDALRDDSRTDDPILFKTATGFRRSEAAQRSSFRMDWLFSYQPNPGTVFFAGYGATLGAREFFSPGDLERTTDGFFIKLSYLLRM